MVVTFLAMYAAASAWSLAAHHPRDLRAGFALAVTTPNVGNMGIPVAFLAFGQAGFDIAVMNFVVGAVLSYSAGIFIASMAGGTAVQALRAPFRYPVVYAAVAGIAINALGVELPITFAAPIETLAGAAIPTMLIVLGLQLQSALAIEDIRDTAVANLGRLMLAPVVTWFAATALGLDGVTRDTLTVLAAMPTAVIATVIATEFSARPGFVTRSVVVSTLASMLTLTVLISLL